MSSTIYRDWVFPQQALPADLFKRGVAVEDSSCPHGVRLLIRTILMPLMDLKYGEQSKHGFKITVIFTTRLIKWFRKIPRFKHGGLKYEKRDTETKKDELWWPKMESCKDLVETCTIIIWVASALHAAVNFGQYPYGYGGYHPNCPSTSRRFIPEINTPEYEELKLNREKAYLRTITSQMQSVLVLKYKKI